MDAVEFLKKYHKLCDYRSCDDCPLLKRVDGFKTCLAGGRNGYEERVVEIVEKWSKEQENKMTKAEAIELLSNDAFKLCMVRLRDPLFEECYEALNMAIEALQQEPKWIPVSERLPEEGLTVLIFTEGGNIEFGQRFGNKWEWLAESISDYWTIGDHVIAWMPLPEPYRSE